MWHKGFYMDGEKIGFNQLVVRLSEKSESPYDMGDEYRKYHLIEQKERYYNQRMRRMRLMPKVYRPLITTSYVRDDVVSYLKHSWLGERHDIDEHIVLLMLEECQWLDMSSDEFFKKYEPIMLHRFINMIPTRRGKTKLLSRGGSGSKNMIECLMDNNTSSSSRMSLLADDSTVESDERANGYIMQCSSRISLWIDIIEASGHEYGMLDGAYNDLKRLSRDYRDTYYGVATRDQDRLTCMLMKSLKENSNLDTKRVYCEGTSVYLPMQDNSDSRARYSYTRHAGCPVLTRAENGEITHLSADLPRVYDQVKGYAKYRHTQYGGMQVSRYVKPLFFKVRNCSLIVCDGNIEIGGFLGYPYLYSKNPVNMDFLGYERVETNLLEHFMNCRESFSQECKDALIESSTVVQRALINHLAAMTTNRFTLKFRPSSSVFTDSEVPDDVMKGDDYMKGILEANEDDFFNSLVRFDTFVSEDDEDSDEEDRERFDQFIQTHSGVWETSNSEMIPGVVSYEIDRKRRYDEPACMKEFSMIIKQMRFMTSFRFAGVITNFLATYDDILDAVRQGN